VFRELQSSFQKAANKYFSREGYVQIQNSFQASCLTLGHIGSTDVEARGWSISLKTRLILKLAACSDKNVTDAFQEDGSLPQMFHHPPIELELQRLWTKSPALVSIVSN
jgi:hypothetical protein